MGKAKLPEILPRVKGNRRSTLKTCDGRVVKPDHMKFAEEFATNGNILKKAMLVAYPEMKDQPKIKLYNKARKLLQKPHVRKHIEGVYERLGTEALPSVDTLARLRDNGKNEKIQLESAKALLDNWNVQEKIKKFSETNNFTQNNVLIAGLSDEELIQRINLLKHGILEQPRVAEVIPGAGEETVPEGPDVSDGEHPSVSEPGTGAQGDSGSTDEGGEGKEEGPLPPPAWPLKVN